MFSDGKGCFQVRHYRNIRFSPVQDRPRILSRIGRVNYCDDVVPAGAPHKAVGGFTVGGIEGAFAIHYCVSFRKGHLLLPVEMVTHGVESRAGTFIGIRSGIGGSVKVIVSHIIHAENRIDTFIVHQDARIEIISVK